MKEETILDVLLFLFENYIYDDPDVVRDRDSLQKTLLQAGFSPTETNKAFDWLEELSRERPDNPAKHSDTPLRLFAEIELQRLDTESRGFLMFLEQQSQSPAINAGIVGITGEACDACIKNGLNTVLGDSA